MISPINGAQVYVVLGNTDMRKAIDGLSTLVAGPLGLNPFSGHIFVFSNRSRTAIKLLVWDRNGFWICHKRLEKERFRWPRSESEVMSMTSRELHWLLDGLDPTKIDGHRTLDYSQIV